MTAEQYKSMEKDVNNVAKALKIAEMRSLTTEVVTSAIRIAKENPDYGVAHIMVKALDEWDL